MDNPTTAQANLAEFDRRNAEIADWRRIEPRATAEVRSLADYRRLTGMGRLDAFQYLSTKANALNPSREEITAAHLYIFWRATKDAGQFRQAGQPAIYGGRSGAEAQRVEIELDRLHSEMDELLAAAKNGPEKCAAVAFYHARFIGIHPFMDGNGRVGRAIMEAQLQSLGLKIDLTQLPKAAYIGALGSALDQNDLGPLTRALGTACGVEISPEQAFPAPSRVSCRPMLNLDDIYPLPKERDLARAFRPLPPPSRERAHAPAPGIGF